jgi:hypothetical protein
LVLFLVSQPERAFGVAADRLRRALEHGRDGALRQGCVATFQELEESRL